MDTRDVALTVLLDIETNQTFSNIALGNALRKNQFTDKVERAFLSRLVEGVTETKLRLDYVIDQYSKTKIKKCKPVIACLLRMGCYQILFMDSVPDSAACNECVKLAKKTWLCRTFWFCERRASDDHTGENEACISRSKKRTGAVFVRDDINTTLARTEAYLGIWHRERRNDLSGGICRPEDEYPAEQTSDRRKRRDDGFL
jgi:transcription termination factor NusB